MMGNIMVNKVSKVGPDLDFFFFFFEIVNVYSQYSFVGWGCNN